MSTIYTHAFEDLKSQLVILFIIGAEIYYLRESAGAAVVDQDIVLYVMPEVFR